MVLLSTVVATPRINLTWINFAILPGGRWVLTTPPTLIIPIQSKRPLGPELEGRCGACCAFRRPLAFLMMSSYSTSKEIPLHQLKQRPLMLCSFLLYDIACHCFICRQEGVPQSHYHNSSGYFGDTPSKHP